MLNNPVSSPDWTEHARSGAARRHYDLKSQLSVPTDEGQTASWDLQLKTHEFSHSRNFSALLGFKVSRLTSYGEWLDAIHPDDLPLHEHALDEAMQTGTYSCDVRVVWPDKVLHWTRVNGRVVFNKAHRPDRLLGTMMDITSEKKSLLALRQNELAYRGLVYNLPFGFYTCDVNGKIGIYNDAAVQLWGKEPGKDDNWSGALKIFKPDGSLLPAEECPLALTVKTGQVVNAEEILIEQPDGNRVNVMPHPQLVYDEQGNITGGIDILTDISENKKAEKDTAWLGAIIESSEDAVISKTLEGIVTSWNNGAEKLFGYTADEMIGEPISTLFPEDRMEEEPKILERLKRGEVISHFDTIRLNKAGEPIDISLTISPIKDKNGHLIGASKIARNISVQKNLYKALQENELRLQIAVSTAELGTWELCSKTNKVLYSRRYLEIMGFGPDEIPAHTELLSRVHPEDLDRRAKALESALSTGILDMELRVVYPDQSIHWIKVRGKTFYDDHHQPDRILGTVLDITAQKKAFEALQESELLFKTIANVSPVGLWMTDAEARNTFVNATWIEWTGQPLEQQYDAGWMRRLLPEDTSRVKLNFIKAMTTRKVFNDEFRLMRKDGEIRWCLTEGFPFYNDQGAFEGYAGSVTDITERKMIEKELETKVHERTQALNMVNNALEKSNGELEEFAYVASHDLQEPLRKIKTFVGRLQESVDTGIDAHSRVYMEKIISSTNRMSDLIRDLLEYSRTARISEKHSLTHLREILENVEGDLELLINQKRATIVSGSLPSLYAVPHQMNQLFANLLSNSLKFLDESRSPVITITSFEPEKEALLQYGFDPNQKYVEIVFADNGIGFSNEYAEKVFEIFQRLNPRSAYSGSGIGLSICRKIVNNHQGKIFADSVEGEGTSFHIILPVGSDPVAPVETVN